MTTELEKQFFETFGIEKTRFIIVCDVKECLHKKNIGKFACLSCQEESKKDVLDYPIITDTHYFQLLCLLAKGMGTVTLFKDQNINDIKDTIVYGFILGKEYFTKQQVQALFKRE